MILILISVVIIIGIIFGFLYFKNKKTPADVTVTNPVYQTFEPFGSSEGIAVNETSQVQTNIKETEKFYRLTDFSTAGATFYQDKKILSGQPTTTGESKIDPKTKKVILEIINFDLIPSLRYTERSTGHVYNMEIKSKNKQVISNTTIPAIYEVLFNKDANNIIYRYLSEDRKIINSYLAKLGSANGEFLSQNILSIATSPNKDKFFYFIKDNNGGVLGITRLFNSSTKTQIWASSFTEWIPQWVTEQSIFLTTKASYMTEGGLFSLNIKTGVLTKVLGEIYGLTTLANNDGTKVLYNNSTSSGPKLNIFNLKNNSSLAINIYGLPEKCVWDKGNIYIYCAIPNTIESNQYPDIWYQGLVSFDDSFIKIDSNTGKASVLINSSDVTSVDAINLFLSDNEEQLFFTNKKDYTLWEFDLF